MKTVDIFTDGACSGNLVASGRGGWACILLYPNNKDYVGKKELSGGEIHTTNNRMELTAVIEGLKALKEPCNVTIYSDSQYVCKAFNEKWLEGWIKKNWNGVKNVDLWKTLLIYTHKHNVTFKWIKGHSGNVWNERCDELAVMESKKGV